jgi:hypothetical protein
VLTFLRIIDAVVSLRGMQRLAGPCAQQSLWRASVQVPRVQVSVRVQPGLCLVRLVAVGAAAQYKTGRYDGGRNTHD